MRITLLCVDAALLNVAKSTAAWTVEFERSSHLEAISYQLPRFRQ